MALQDETIKDEGRYKGPYAFAPPASSLSLESLFSATSTQTASDIAGPGRLIDKHIYSKGGRAIESSLARLAHAAGYGPVATANRIGANLQGFSQDSDMSIEAIFADSHGELRLELGIITDVERLKKDCRKLFKYSRSNVLATRIQALRMIIMLYIRFPYLNTYVDAVEQRACSPMNDGNTLEWELEHMAYACIAPPDNAQSVARLIDHLAETTKLGRVLQIRNTTGPGSNIPNGKLVLKYCTDPQTAFASLRFTALIFRHSYLSRGQEFYVKFNRPTAELWESLHDCVIYHLRAFSDDIPSCATCSTVENLDWRGIDLFVETILEMLCRAVTWHEVFNLTEERYSLVRDITLPLCSSKAQALLKNAAFVANSKLIPFLEQRKEHIIVYGND